MNLTMNLKVRKASASDQTAISEVVLAAFGGNQGREVDELISALLPDGTARPVISLVAEADGRVVGHILFTKARLEGCCAAASAAILAPLAVHPGHQGRGVGEVPYPSRTGGVKSDRLRPCICPWPPRLLSKAWLRRRRHQRFRGPLSDCTGACRRMDGSGTPPWHDWKSLWSCDLRRFTHGPETLAGMKPTSTNKSVEPSHTKCCWKRKDSKLSELARDGAWIIIRLIWLTNCEYQE